MASSAARPRLAASAWRWASGVLVAGQRGLRHERPDPGVVGRVVEDDQLLVEHGQLLAGPHQPAVDVAERPFDEGSAHAGNSTHTSRDPDRRRRTPVRYV